MTRIPKDQQEAARQVAWLLLMALKLKYLRKETLQARVCVPEQEGVSLEQEGPGEVEPTDGSKDNVTAGTVAPALQAGWIMKRRLNHNQPVGLKGHPWLQN